MSDWKERFATLGFRPTEMGGMNGKFEDIDIVAVEHPFEGLCLMGNQFDGRHFCQFETFIPVDSDLAAIAAALVRIHDLVHPQTAPSQALESARKRPSNQEALEQVPDLIRQIYSALAELNFLFPHRMMLDEYLDREIGELIAAYVYDLELTGNHHHFSEARSRDGRTVQLRITIGRAREMVPLREVCDHLLVVQLWKRQISEVYNGPLGPIWAMAKTVRKDGSRSISKGRLCGHNEHAVSIHDKIEEKRLWKLTEEDAKD